MTEAAAAVVAVLAVEAVAAEPLAEIASLFARLLQTPVPVVP
jgi:hypothetical protein